MTDIELDTVYTRLCQTMTELGEKNASLFLARFALLSVCALDDPKKTLDMIESSAAHFRADDQTRERAPINSKTSDFNLAESNLGTSPDGQEKPRGINPV